MASVVPVPCALVPASPRSSSRLADLLFLKRMTTMAIPARRTAPPTPTTTPMMVFFCLVERPEELFEELEASLSDSFGGPVGVDSSVATVDEIEVETSPLLFVTTMVLLIVRTTVLVGIFVVEVVVVVSSSKTVLVDFVSGGGFGDVGSFVGSSGSEEVGGGVEVVGGVVVDVVSFVVVADVDVGPDGVGAGGDTGGSSSSASSLFSSCRLHISLLLTSRGSSKPWMCSARVERTSINAASNKASHSVVDLILNMLYHAQFFWCR